MRSVAQILVQRWDPASVGKPGMVLYRVLRALAVTDDADVMGEGSGSGSGSEGSGSDSDDDGGRQDTVHGEVLAMLQALFIVRATLFYACAGPHRANLMCATRPRFYRAASALVP